MPLAIIKVHGQLAMLPATREPRTELRLERRPRRGFTLLELVIVLAVMVGMLAVVWPNLQRPLQRTSLDEAAQMVRDAIDESRYQSALRGGPYFVRLQQGSGQLFSGSFESFLNADSDAGSLLPSTAGSGSGLSIDSTGAGRSQSVRTWNLPTSVVISRVDWTLEAVYSSTEDEDAFALQDANLPLDPASAGTLEATDSSSLSGSATGRQWWLPLTAVGRGRDATIELYDASINQRLRVTYSSATGALEITR